MKKICFLLLLLLLSTATFAQKKEKIKGSKSVTMVQKEIAPFEGLEITDNIEVFLVKGATQSLEIEADDNLHDIIMHEMNGNTLRIFTGKDAGNYKKLSVRITYTDDLKTITTKNEVALNAVMDITLENVTITMLDASKSFMNIKATNFILNMNDKSKAEINLKAENVIMELSKNANFKGVVAATNVKLDLYQKSNATIEGETTALQLRLDNNAALTGKKFISKAVVLTTESYSSCSILATDTISISAIGKSEVQLFGDPKIEIIKFTDNATLYKKVL